MTVKQAEQEALKILSSDFKLLTYNIKEVHNILYKNNTCLVACWRIDIDSPFKSVEAVYDCVMYDGKKHIINDIVFTFENNKSTEMHFMRLLNPTNKGLIQEDITELAKREFKKNNERILAEIKIKEKFYTD